MEVPVADVAYAFQPVVDLYKTKVNLCRSWRVYWFSIEIEFVPSVDGLIDELRKQIDTHWIVKCFGRLQLSDKEKYPGGPMLSFGPWDCFVRPTRFETLCDRATRITDSKRFLLEANEMERMKHDI